MDTNNDIEIISEYKRGKIKVSKYDILDKFRTNEQCQSITENIKKLLNKIWKSIILSFSELDYNRNDQQVQNS